MLKNKFKVLTVGHHRVPATMKRVVYACVILHNILRDRYPKVHDQLLDRYDENGVLIEAGAWRQDVGDDPDEEEREALYRGGNYGALDERQQREYLGWYFSDPERGAKDWQWEGVYRYT